MPVTADVLTWGVAPGPVGDLVVVATSAGVVRGGWADPEDAVAEVADRLDLPVDDAPARRGPVVEARRQLDEYFDGRRKAFDVPLDRSLSDGFRLDVLEALSTVPWGETVTYGELAAMAGRPRAARAVGAAMATNPIPVLVPCHRVLASNGLGGYGGRSGTPSLDTKRFLLRLEGHRW